jgi:hypothetical protein
VCELVHRTSVILLRRRAACQRVGGSSINRSADLRSCDNTVSFSRLKLQLPQSPLRHHYIKARVIVREYPDGTLAIFHGPRGIGRFDASGRQIVARTRARMAPCSPPPRRGLATPASAAPPSRRRSRAAVHPGCHHQPQLHAALPDAQRGLNNQLEQEVQAIEAAQEGAATRHFAELRAWRVKLSDADAFNWTSIEGLSIPGFLLVLLRVTYMPNTDVGTIFAIFVYVWRLMEKLDMMPQIVQQLMRLKDIRRRIEAGASIEAIGEQIQRTGTDKSGPL